MDKPVSDRHGCVAAPRFVLRHSPVINPGSFI